MFFAKSICLALFLLGLPSLVHSLTVPMPACADLPRRPTGGKCNQTQDCYTLISKGREACFYSCGKRPTGRRGYQCYQRPPLRVAWQANFSNSLSTGWQNLAVLPYVNSVSPAGLVTDSTASSGSDSTPRWKYTFTNSSTPERASFFFEINDCGLRGANLQIIDSNHTLVVDFYVSSNAEFPDNLAHAVMNGADLGVVNPFQRYSLEFGMDFTIKKLLDIELGDSNGNNMVMKANGTAFSGNDVKAIQLFNSMPCSSTWDDFLTWDRFIPKWRSY